MTRRLTLIAAFAFAAALLGMGSQASAAAKIDMGLLNKVNAQVNHDIRPMSDEAQYGGDRWVSEPASGFGDCDDYAMTKMTRLAKAGVAAEDMSIALVYTETGEYHAVLSVKTAKGEIILDNRMNWPTPRADMERFGYHWANATVAKTDWTKVFAGAGATK
ncbi:transglutaminase-like cysteine peptidase [Caulobacter segnis]|uniref:transglutaminase-like cysteine peptidase n=1 Tax=Caulobacter segnis TaxID=88688 RepID=UPI00240F96B2|nr:transglutaminase-like cysteine peptidase [Caulobacter segnis]MDG2523740.1 transglutaminase-like cysteine peptidase [Caulobacter segnis]